VRRWIPDLDRPRTITLLRWAIGVVLIAALLVFLVRGANNPKDPYLAPPGSLPLHAPSVAVAPVSA